VAQLSIILGNWSSNDPDVCFVAGPDDVADPSAAVPTNVSLGEIQVQTVNRLIARSAKKL
jgi:hypothetical protein